MHGGFWAINELPRRSFSPLLGKGEWAVYQLPREGANPTGTFLVSRYQVRISSSPLFLEGAVLYLALWSFHLAFAARFDYRR